MSRVVVVESREDDNYSTYQALLKVKVLAWVAQYYSSIHNVSGNCTQSVCADTLVKCEYPMYLPIALGSQYRYVSANRHSVIKMVTIEASQKSVLVFLGTGSDQP